MLCNYVGPLHVSEKVLYIMGVTLLQVCSLIPQKLLSCFQFQPIRTTGKLWKGGLFLAMSVPLCALFVVVFCFVVSFIVYAFMCDLKENS